MSLRAKCALLVLAFELTLAVTLVLTVRYIGKYFENAAGAFAASSGRLAQVNRLRTLARNELTHLLQFVPHPSDQAACQLCTKFAEEFESASASVLADRSGLHGSGFLDLEQPLLNRSRAIAGYRQALRTAGRSAAVQFDPRAHLDLDTRLGRLEAESLQAAQEAVENPYRVQQKAILILSANAVVGAILGVLGMVLIRRWVLRPVQELKLVTDEIGKGNLEHRAPVLAQDELGQLSAAVNKMSSDLARIEKQMVQRERAAAMGELMSHVAHNIRNPLAGIQTSAEATRRQLDEGSPLRAHQDAIIAAIDRFQRWLRELEHTCRPLEVQPVPTDVRMVLEDVVAVFRPMAERRSIVIERRIDDSVQTVFIDPRHFEQALAAVVGNALEVTPDHGKVVIMTEAEVDPAHWSLSVIDAGPGIPLEIRGKIFEPSFSTKRTGHGLGLALARKVIELHGGQINVECPPEGGSVFRVMMPAQPDARTVHG
jgi:signal transduction histidine kinase